MTPSGFQTTIRLPPHRHQLDEGKFLRLLCYCVALSKRKKRLIIEAVPELSQFKICKLIEIMEEEAVRLEETTTRSDNLERLRKKQREWWMELEKEME